MTKSKRSGLQEPSGGRPTLPKEIKRVRCGDLTLPKWLHTWLHTQDDPAGHIIEQAVIEKFKLKPPRI